MRGLADRRRVFTRQGRQIVQVLGLSPSIWFKIRSVPARATGDFCEGVWSSSATSSAARQTISVEDAVIKDFLARMLCVMLARVSECRKTKGPEGGGLV